VARTKAAADDAGAGAAGVVGDGAAGVGDGVEWWCLGPWPAWPWCTAEPEREARVARGRSAAATTSRRIMVVVVVAMNAAIINCLRWIFLCEERVMMADERI
jgi:hypothetical protein